MHTSPKTIGLALGSGGWRGLAHIGVIKSLLNHGFEIKAVAGASSGAIMGGLYCLWHDIEHVEQTFIHLKYQDLLYAFSDPAQRLGLIHGHRTFQLFQKYTQNAQIESLSIPFQAVATNLLSGERIIFKSGDLAQAFRASSSIPLIFEPYEFEGKLLVDGALSNPIPVDLVRQMNVDIVIAVNCYNCIFPLTSPKHSLNRFQFITLSEQLMLNQLSLRDAKKADLQINPLLEDAQAEPFFRFINNQAAIDSGERAMDLQLPALYALNAKNNGIS